MGKMNKQIVHFGQDPDKKEFHNLIVKVTDIGPAQFLDIQEELLFKGFTIYYQDGNTIEASFKNRYLEVANKFREIEKEGWKSGEITNEFP